MMTYNKKLVNTDIFPGRDVSFHEEQIRMIATLK